MNIYRKCVRPILFRIDPERVHRLALRLLPLMPDFSPDDSERLRVDLLGTTFRNPVGLAAGFDKEGRSAADVSRFGFGHVEIGTLTPRPQAGNPTPRLFRFPGKEAIVNRMGFNNPGAKEGGRVLSALRGTEISRFRLGVNIGKQRETPIEEAAADYMNALESLLPFADYVVINVSSPNTPGLRALESAAALEPLLREVRRFAVEFAGRKGVSSPPLLAKLSPDLGPAGTEASAEAVKNARFDGLILTNTTTDLSLLGIDSPPEGGLSGRPLAERALETVRIARRATSGTLPIIGVGGVFSGEDAYRRIRAGASMVQLYTALVYNGPFTVRSILLDLDHLLAAEGFTNILEAVGTEDG